MGFTRLGRDLRNRAEDHLLDLTSASAFDTRNQRVGSGENAVTRVTVENPSKNLAFFVRLKLDKGKGGDEILPVVWQDNYISLLPGEKREITATYRAGLPETATPEVEVSGWNVE